MEYVRTLDRAAYDAVPVSERFTHEFLDRASGAQQSRIRLIRTPPGGGSPEGFHTHEFEQVFYVVEGTMTIEVDGVRAHVPAGSVAVFPQGMPHRNWNETDQPTVHIAIDSPAPAIAAPAPQAAAQ
jgi:quercetin dioxygenase-like cupin family protein